MRSSRASRLSRKAASRAGSGSESALTRWAAASCSTTGPPRSMVVRAAAKRWIRGSSARIQPVRSPAQCDLLREPMETTAGLKAASGVRGDAVEVQLPQRLVHHQHSARRCGGLTSRRRWESGISRPVGLWKSGDHVGHRGPLLHQRGLQGLEVPARHVPPEGAPTAVPAWAAGMATGTGRQPAARMASRAFG